MRLPQEFRNTPRAVLRSDMRRQEERLLPEQFAMGIEIGQDQGRAMAGRQRADILKPSNSDRLTKAVAW